MSTPSLTIQQAAELVYWNLRAVMENAKDCIESPNPIWSYMNELYENISQLEKVLSIANPMEAASDVNA